MRFPARGAWNAKFHPSYMNIGYVQTTFSEPEFLECIDKQIFVPMMLRYNANCYIARNFFLTARAIIGYFEVTCHQTNETVSRQNLWKGTLLNLCRQRETVHCYPRMLTGSAIHSIQFPEISVQNSMDRFGATGKVSKKLIHLLRWITFPGRTGLNFGWMDRAPALQREWISSYKNNKSLSGNIEILGKQNWLFPSGLVMKCLLFYVL